MRFVLAQLQQVAGSSLYEDMTNPGGLWSCVCPCPSPKVSERQTEGNIWERVTRWHENRKVSAWEAWIAVRAGMSRNSSSQAITCVCHCHLVIASCCKVPKEKLRNGSICPECSFCSSPMGWQLSHPELPLSWLQPCCSYILTAAATVQTASQQHPQF